MNKLNMKKAGLLFTLLSLIFSLFLFSCQSLGEIGAMLAEDEDSSVAAIGQSLTAMSKVGEKITPENEYYIGRSVAAAITKKYKIYKDAPETTEYLNLICRTLALNSSIPFLYKGYYVVILDTDELNAMATPGGHIFVSRGLIAETQSEDALAAVIAHEMGHIQLKHSISAIKANRVSNAINATSKAFASVSKDVIAEEHMDEMESLGLSEEELFECADELLATQEEIVSALMVSGFSQEQEFLADEEALTLMENAGYDSSALIEMLKVISGNTSTGGWNDTHPAPQDRIDNVIDDLKYADFMGEDKSVRQKRFEEKTAALRG